jgi:hypothetical protein
MEAYNSKYHNIINESNKRWKQSGLSMEPSNPKNGSIQAIPEEDNTPFNLMQREISIIELDSQKIPQAPYPQRVSIENLSPGHYIKLMKNIQMQKF